MVTFVGEGGTPGAAADAISVMELCGRMNTCAPIRSRGSRPADKSLSEEPRHPERDWGRRSGGPEFEMIATIISYNLSVSIAYL